MMVLFITCVVVCARVVATPHVICRCGHAEKNVCARALYPKRKYRSDQIKPITGMIVADER